MDVVECRDWLSLQPQKNILSFEQKLIGVGEQGFEIEVIVGVLENGGEQVQAIEGMQI